VYRELRILTARPTPADEARASHALYGFVSGAEAYSAGRYADDAAAAIAAARARGKVPIVVGGTGLYFKVLLEGQRIVRALEVLETSGRSLADWQRTPGRPVLSEDYTTRLLLTPDQDGYAARIDRRFEAMLTQGAMERLGLPAELPVMRALGVAPLAACLGGRMSLAEAAERAQTETRQYAKRQRTWLGRNMMSWKAFYAQQMIRIIGGDLSFIEH
jgi:tRNA dimethylallyltransferase